MVQRPFSDDGGKPWSRIDSGLPQLASITATGTVQTNMIHKKQRQKITTIFSAVDTVRNKSAPSKKMSRNGFPNEFRTARNILLAPNRALQPFTGNDYSAPINMDHKQENNIAKTNPYPVLRESKFFPPVEDQELQSIEQKNSKENIVFPEEMDSKVNNGMHLKSVFMAHKNSTERIDNVLQPKLYPPEIIIADSPDGDSNKADYLLHGNPVDIETMYSFNSSVNPYVCETLTEVDADIDAQNKYFSLNIEVIIIG